MMENEEMIRRSIRQDEIHFLVTMPKKVNDKMAEIAHRSPKGFWENRDLDLKEQAYKELEQESKENDTLRDFRGNPIPLKEDGSVNQTAFWNADPEAWAKWNDSQRNDGGVNSRGYIAKAVKKLQSDAKAVQKQIDEELDFDKIEQLEGQFAEINSRINTLNNIEQGYDATGIA